MKMASSSFLIICGSLAAVLLSYVAIQTDGATTATSMMTDGTTEGTADGTTDAPVTAGTSGGTNGAGTSGVTNGGTMGSTTADAATTGQTGSNGATGSSGGDGGGSTATESIMTTGESQSESTGDDMTTESTPFYCYECNGTSCTSMRTAAHENDTCESTLGICFMYKNELTGETIRSCNSTMSYVATCSDPYPSGQLASGTCSYCCTAGKCNSVAVSCDKAALHSLSNGLLLGAAAFVLLSQYSL